VMINAYWQPLDFGIHEGANWSRVIDTALPSGQDIVPTHQAQPPMPRYIVFKNAQSSCLRLAALFAPWQMARRCFVPVMNSCELKAAMETHSIWTTLLAG